MRGRVRGARLAAGFRLSETGPSAGPMAQRFVAVEPVSEFGEQACASSRRLRPRQDARRPRTARSMTWEGSYSPAGFTGQPPEDAPVQERSFVGRRPRTQLIVGDSDPRRRRCDRDGQPEPGEGGWPHMGASCAMLGSERYTEMWPAGSARASTGLASKGPTAVACRAAHDSAKTYLRHTNCPQYRCASGTDHAPDCRRVRPFRGDPRRPDGIAMRPRRRSMRPASGSSRRGTRRRQRVALELREDSARQHLAAMHPGLGEAESGPLAASADKRDHRRHHPVGEVRMIGGPG